MEQKYKGRYTELGIHKRKSYTKEQAGADSQR